MQFYDRHSSLAEIPGWEQLAYSERFSEQWMESQRQVGDPLADQVIAELKERFPIQDPTDMLQEVCRLAEEEGGVFREFVEACNHVPAWADFDAMEAGAKLFASHTPLIMLSILAGGVIGSAFHVNAEPVFTNTGRFVVEDGVAARLVETGAILGLVPFIEEVKPGGRHHQVVMKVRILHAAIRHWSLQKSGEDAYPVEQCGLPINQQDMAYAMLIFSYFPVRGMLRLGVELSREQIDSLHLLWRYVGYVSGVSEDWDCQSIEEQKELYYAFVKHQARPGVVSLAALSLLDGTVDGAPDWAARFLSGTLRSMTSYLGGTDFLQGLYLEERGNRLGFKLGMGFAKAWNMGLKLPFGERLLTKAGMAALKKRYGNFGSVADTHHYDVKIHSSDSVKKSLQRQRERLKQLA